MPALFDKLAIPCGDLSTALTSTSGPEGDGTNLASYVMPAGFLWVTTEGCLYVPDTSGITVDVNIDGTSGLATKLTIEANESWSGTAAAQPVLAGRMKSLPIDRGSRVSFDLDNDGAGVGAGLVVTLLGYWYG